MVVDEKVPSFYTMTCLTEACLASRSSPAFPSVDVTYFLAHLGAMALMYSDRVGSESERVSHMT